MEEKHTIYRRPILINGTLYLPCPKDFWDGKETWLDLRNEQVLNEEGQMETKMEEVGIIPDKGKHGRYLAFFNPRQQKEEQNKK